MVKLSELPAVYREGYLAMEVPAFDETPWAPCPPLFESRIAIISTAGLHRRDDHPFDGYAADYRVIPGDADMNDLVMSHLSTNFDRTGFYQDVNVAFPIDRLRELRDDGFIGAVADHHFSFMGATPPTAMEPVVAQLVGILRADKVDAVLLVPV
ncbi:MAG: glycine/sarcosine/betaine reductase selenoprotein B family protein [Proteobacteria bacterium]|nr:glycine/sarcosine/betaine reductase selenoprotein B family protein [Pseudomonadota bacterium]